MSPIVVVESHYLLGSSADATQYVHSIRGLRVLQVIRAEYGIGVLNAKEARSGVEWES
jgi:hypothetical protein